MQFISVCTTTGDYVLDPRAKEFLSSPPLQENPLTIVSVIGRYRTGKSSLLNGLIGTDTFRTSSTVQAQTKGIMLHQLNASTLLLDTEGLGSMDVSRDHDASIFALAMLVSSGCFFNNLGSITSQSVEDLHLASKVAGLLCKHAKFNKQLPDLVWLMRDFSLDLVDRNGLEISADVFFEQCLDKCEETKSAHLRALFPSRRCIPLTRPTVEETDLREMSNLRPEFLEGVEHIRSIVRNFKPKTLGDKKITGSQICSLVEALCEVLNSDAVPDMGNVWQLVAAQSRRQALEQAAVTFKQADSTLDGISNAFTTYKSMILDDVISGDETFTIMHDLIRMDSRGQDLEETYRMQQREFAVYKATAVAQLKEGEERLSENEKIIVATRLRVAVLVDDGLVMQNRLQEFDSALPAAPAEDESAALIEALEGLQTKHKELKLELLEKKRMLDDVTQTIQTQDQTILGHLQRMETGRKTQSMQRLKLTELEGTVFEVKTDLNRSTTDAVVWRTRYEDIVSRMEKKRKFNEDTHTDFVAMTSEVKFLRSRHEEDVRRLKENTHENMEWSKKVQALQIKLALEVGK